jgi:two-component system phosphate regulon response regulator PhoB
LPKVVLVIDDEMEFRTFVSLELEAVGYIVWEAESMSKGLAWVVDDPPDLIIMDVLMPDQSGLELYRTIKTDPDLNDLPVLIMSGMARKTFRHALRTGNQAEGINVPEPEGYIEKPPGPDELLDEVKRILGK